MNILIVGLGYVGLTKMLYFAQKNKVYGYDIDPDKDIRNENPLWITEPGLEELRKSTLPNTYQIDLETSVQETDIAFVCVGTPSGDMGEVKLDYVYQAMNDLGRNIAKASKEEYNVVLKSTVTPGTSAKCIKILEQTSGLVHGEGLWFTMVPEFLQEGSALTGLGVPDKIVIGYKYLKELNTVRDLYLNSLGRIAKNRVIICPCNYVNAEFIKYANNAMLATKISFINEIANFCEYVEGADVNVIANAIGVDSRISPRFLKAGLGFGGSCFGKDVDALREFSDRNGLDSTFLSEVLAINYSQRDWAVSTAKKAMNDHVKHEYKRRVAILGLAFKPGTDDLRDAPSVDIIKQFLLYPEEYQVVVHDPVVRKVPISKATSWNILYQENVNNAIRNSDCIIICTDWDEYKNILPETFTKEMRTPIIIDGRRIYKPQKMIYSDINYYGVGYGRFDARN